MIWGNSIPRMHCNVLHFLIATHSTTFVKFLKCSAGRKFVSRKTVMLCSPGKLFILEVFGWRTKIRKLAEKARHQGRRKSSKPGLAPVYTDQKKRRSQHGWSSFICITNNSPEFTLTIQTLYLIEKILVFY